MSTYRSKTKFIDLSIPRIGRTSSNGQLVCLRKVEECVTLLLTATFFLCCCCCILLFLFLLSCICKQQQWRVWLSMATASLLSFFSSISFKVVAWVFYMTEFLCSELIMVLQWLLESFWLYFVLILMLHHQSNGCKFIIFSESNWK